MIKKRTLDQVSFHIVDHCNLNCKGCFHYSPLVKKPVFKNLEQHEKEVIKLAELNNNKKICIFLLGGEPLLHPQINDFCEITRKYYSNAQIFINTNGILIPTIDKSFFDTVNKNNIIVRLSDYNLNPTIKEFIFKNIQSYEILRRSKMFNLSLDLKGKNSDHNFQLCQKYKNMACINIRNGRIYQCGYCAYFDYLKEYFNLQLKDTDIYQNSIDMFTSSLQEIEEYLNSSTPFCKYCNIDTMLTNPNNFNNWNYSEKNIEEWIYKI